MPGAEPAALWDWITHCYAQPGVKPACLSAQDTLGLDVNLLLTAAWLASQRRALSPSAWVRLEARVRPWRETVVAPLRAARRAAGDDATLAEAILSVELAAEERAVTHIATWLTEYPEAVAPAEQPLDGVRMNLSAYWASRSARPLPEAVRDLADALVGTGLC